MYNMDVLLSCNKTDYNGVRDMIDLFYMSDTDNWAISPSTLTFMWFCAHIQILHPQIVRILS